MPPKNTGYELLIDSYILNGRKPTQSVIENMDYTISVYYDATHTALSIYCNKTKYSIHKLINILETVAQNHGKKLEVNL